MPSIQAKMISGIFKLAGVNKMLDKQGADFEKLLEKYQEKQKKPLKIPYDKMKQFDIQTEEIGGTTCYTIAQKGKEPEKAVLYLFGGGYILPPDPGDLILCGQIARECQAKVWFPLYPMAPEHRLVETLQSTLSVYQAISLCVYIKQERPDVPFPARLVLQSPGLQVPPSKKQREEMEKKKKKDVMIPPSFFDNIAPVLATGDEAYLLSPMLYDLAGFPPIDLFYGTREVMMAYLSDFEKVCQRYGVKLHVHVGEGMMHCWGAMEFMPEAKAVRQEYFKALD